MTDPVARAALERALGDKDLLLVYQPIFDIRSGNLYGAEALLRQLRQSGEIREASVITDAAEDGPELFELNRWAMHRAYSDAAHWQSLGGHEIRLNVNLSPREFQEGDVLPRLTELITGCGIDVTKVNLEITETSYIEKPEETMHVLEDLKKLGLEIWLDDFGTGHSSIVHLQRFPLDGIKISGDFVAPIVTDHRSRAITRSLISLAHDLDLAVIVEGVEQQEQLDLVREWNCEYVQGFLFARPMTLESFEELLTRSSADPEADVLQARAHRGGDRDPSSRSS